MDIDSRVSREADIIQIYLRPLAARWPGALELRDDCAVITPAPGQDIIVKTDPIRAGIHFFTNDNPDDIAWKALATNVSDLAAKAARPFAYTLALSFPRIPKHDWLSVFAKGLEKAQSAFGCILVGGDTDIECGPLNISVTMFGEIAKGQMLKRGRAKPGDSVFVSGTLGDSSLGLHLRKSNNFRNMFSNYADAALERYLRPVPRLGLRSALRGYARASMDISDGLLKDLQRMCSVSGVGASINARELPLSTAKW